MDDFIPDSPHSDFVPDDTPPQPHGDYWKDVKDNAVQGLKEIPQGLEQLGNQAVKTGKSIFGLTNPNEWIQSGAQRLQGKPMSETNIGQDVGNIYDTAKSGVQGAWQGVKDFAKVPYAAVETAAGVPLSQTKMGESFRERPLSFPVNVAMTAFGAAKGLQGVRAAGEPMFAGAEPNYLERTGAQGINHSLGIQPDTVESMTRPQQNPGKVGTNLGMKLSDEGVGGKGPVPGYDAILQMKNHYGNAVKDAIGQIKANNTYGWDPNYDLLKRDANPILKPILEQANKLQSSSYPNERFESRFHRAVYNDLSEAANANNGTITLDDVRGQMHKIGGMLNDASPTSEHFPILKKIYGRLAGIQDAMVSDIAEAAGSPELKQRLLDANAGYSRYARIEPDVFHASGKVGTGKSGALTGQVKQSIFKTIEPKVANTMYKAGKGARKLFSK